MGATMAQIDVIIEDNRWAEADLEALAQPACDAVFAELSVAQNFEVSLMGCDDLRISELNADFRGKPVPTNVLSWPSVDRAAGVAGQAPTPPDQTDTELGDIALSYDTCAREATDQGKAFADHVSHLIVHGVMHLLGYDHETDQDAALMENTETRILAKLGIADPY